MYRRAAKAFCIIPGGKKAWWFWQQTKGVDCLRDSDSLTHLNLDLMQSAGKTHLYSTPPPGCTFTKHQQLSGRKGSVSNCSVSNSSLWLFVKHLKRMWFKGALCRLLPQETKEQANWYSYPSVSDGVILLLLASVCNGGCFFFFDLDILKESWQSLL